MKSLEQILKEIADAEEAEKIEEFKDQIRSGTIKTISINKKYRELEESLAQNQE